MNNTSNTCMAYDISGLASHPSWFHKQKGFQWDRSYPSDNSVIADTTSSFISETLIQPYSLPNSEAVTVQQKLVKKSVVALWCSNINVYLYVLRCV